MKAYEPLQVGPAWLARLSKTAVNVAVAALLVVGTTVTAGVTVIVAGAAVTGTLDKVAFLAPGPAATHVTHVVLPRVIIIGHREDAYADATPELPSNAVRIAGQADESRGNLAP